MTARYDALTEAAEECRAYADVLRDQAKSAKNKSWQMKTLVIAFLLFLNGCAVLSDHRVAAGCQIADGVTTYYALTHGATEANTLLSGISPAGILLLKVAFAYFVYKTFDPAKRPQSNMDKFATGTVSVIGCIPAINNINVIRGLP